MVLERCSDVINPHTIITNLQFCIALLSVYCPFILAKELTEQELVNIVSSIQH